MSMQSPELTVEQLNKLDHQWFEDVGVILKSTKDKRFARVFSKSYSAKDFEKSYNHVIKLLKQIKEDLHQDSQNQLQEFQGLVQRAKGANGKKDSSPAEAAREMVAVMEDVESFEKTVKKAKDLVKRESSGYNAALDALDKSLKSAASYLGEPRLAEFRSKKQDVVDETISSGDFADGCAKLNSLNRNVEGNVIAAKDIKPRVKQKLAEVEEKLRDNEETLSSRLLSELRDSYLEYKLQFERMDFAEAMDGLVTLGANIDQWRQDAEREQRAWTAKVNKVGTEIQDLLNHQPAFDNNPDGKTWWDNKFAKELSFDLTMVLEMATKYRDYKGAQAELDALRTRMDKTVDEIEQKQADLAERQDLVSSFQKRCDVIESVWFVPVGKLLAAKIGGEAQQCYKDLNLYSRLNGVRNPIIDPTAIPFLLGDALKKALAAADKELSVIESGIKQLCSHPDANDAFKEAIEGLDIDAEDKMALTMGRGSLAGMNAEGTDAMLDRAGQTSKAASDQKRLRELWLKSLEAAELAVHLLAPYGGDAYSTRADQVDQAKKNAEEADDELSRYIAAIPAATGSAEMPDTDIHVDAVLKYERAISAIDTNFIDQFAKETTARRSQLADLLNEFDSQWSAIESKNRTMTGRLNKLSERKRRYSITDDYRAELWARAESAHSVLKGQSTKSIRKAIDKKDDPGVSIGAVESAIGTLKWISAEYAKLERGTEDGGAYLKLSDRINAIQNELSKDSLLKTYKPKTRKALSDQFANRILGEIRKVDCHEGSLILDKFYSQYVETAIADAKKIEEARKTLDPQKGDIERSKAAYATAVGSNHGAAVAEFTRRIQEQIEGKRKKLEQEESQLSPEELQQKREAIVDLERRLIEQLEVFKAFECPAGECGALTETAEDCIRTISTSEDGARVEAASVSLKKIIKELRNGPAQLAKKPEMVLESALSTMNMLNAREEAKRQLEELSAEVEAFMKNEYKQAQKTAKGNAKDEVKMIKQAEKSCKASIQAEDLKTAKEQFQSMRQAYNGIMLYERGDTPLKGLDKFDADWTRQLNEITRIIDENIKVIGEYKDSSDVKEDARQDVEERAIKPLESFKQHFDVNGAMSRLIRNAIEALREPGNQSAGEIKRKREEALQSIRDLNSRILNDPIVTGLRESRIEPLNVDGFRKFLLHAEYRITVTAG